MLRPTVLLIVALAVAGCDGPKERAGEKADAAANVSGGALSQGPQERLGEIADRVDRHTASAVKATADAVADRADEVRAVADQRADALEKQAKEIKQAADKTAQSLDQQADAIRRR